MKKSWVYGKNVSVLCLDDGIFGRGVRSWWDLYGQNFNKHDQGPGPLTALAV